MQVKDWSRRGFLSVGTGGIASAHWSGFRGDGSSLAAGKLMSAWPEKATWRTALPGYGQSSPVLWGKKIFVTSVEGTEKEKLHALCLDAGDGRILWDRELVATQSVKDSKTVSKGAPTGAADGKRAYFFYESGDLAAFGHDGKLQWVRKLSAEFGAFSGNHGVGNSTRLAGDTLLQLVTHGGPSYLLALEAKTGKTKWKADLPPGASWSTPVVHGGLAIASVSSKVWAWRMTDGSVAWTLDDLKGNFIPSVTVAGNLMVVGASEKGKSSAYRLGAGTPELAWRAANATANFCSPLVYGGHVFFVNKVGVLYAMEAETGKELWNERVGGEVWASPVAAGDRLYVFTTEGKAVMYQGGKLAGTKELECNSRVYGVAVHDGGVVVRAGKEIMYLRE